MFLQAFEELLKHVESDDEVRFLMDSLIKRLPSVMKGNMKTAEQMLIKVLTSKPVDFSTFTSTYKFKQYPVKQLMDLHNKDVSKRYCLLLSEFVTRHFNSKIIVRKNVQFEPEWRGTFEKFNIPSIARLDLVGLYFNTLDISETVYHPSKVRLQCCDNMKIILRKSIIYSKRKNVLNPIVALILNIFKTFGTNTGTLDDSDGFIKFMISTMDFHLTGIS
jgi:hypothetical protein